MSENKEDYSGINNRNIGLDFLRIICMVMILILHYLSKGGLLDAQNSNHTNYITYNILETLAIIAVNCYILISGYFLVKSEFKIKKFLNLWGEVFFYSVTIYVVLYLFGLIEFKFTDVIKSIVPVVTKQYWFVNVYLVMYLLMPFLNKLIYALGKEEFKKLLILLIIIFSVMTVLPAEWCLDKTGGYGIIWFVCLYFIGAYIRLFIANDYIEKYHNKWIFIYFICVIFIVVAKLSIDWICKKLVINAKGEKVWAYNNPVILIESIMLFLYFNSLRIKSKWISKMILKIAPLTFAVYLIHEQTVLSKILYSNILHTEICYNNSFGVWIVMGSVLLIFCICVIIEYIRKSSLTFIKNKIKNIKILNQ